MYMCTRRYNKTELSVLPADEQQRSSTSANPLSAGEEAKHELGPTLSNRRQQTKLQKK